MNPARLARFLSIEDFRQAARQRLPRAIFDFIDGGAEDELTLRDNRYAFERIRLLPRVLNDVSAPHIEGELLGASVRAPLVVAPMGSCMLAWPQADIAIARAAHAHGLPYTLSTMSTTSIERMARAVQGVVWFQLYVLKDHEFNLQLIDRAQAHGYCALIVTVDLQAGGKREKDYRNGISIPLRPSWRLLRDGLTHPAWAWQLMRGGFPQFENVAGYGGMVDNGLPIAARVGQAWTMPSTGTSSHACGNAGKGVCWSKGCSIRKMHSAWWRWASTASGFPTMGAASSMGPLPRQMPCP
jgi:L-lactate dehydrogenase (cytochrome)/(S)-mandelate dehydrogenase